MSNIFQSIFIKKPKRYYHNLSHTNQCSFNQGELIPVLVEEILPGDKMSLSVEALVRFAPMVSPMMTRNNLRFYAFYVPNRIVDSNWQSFIFGNEDGTSGPQSLLAVSSTVSSQPMHRLLDYLGYLPLTAPFTRSYTFSNPYPYLSYVKIYNEFFRDQNLQDEYVINRSTINPNNFVASVGLLRKAWEKDYFTSALPFLQRGPASSLPISFSGSDVTTSIFNNEIDGVSQPWLKSTDSPAVSSNLYDTGVESSVYHNVGVVSDKSAGTIWQPSNLAQFLRAESTLDEIEASFLINDFRKANKLQEFLEKNARGGARPTEQLRVHFGVRPSDARLQRPEFLGALTLPISISEVLQHSETTSTGTPLGEMGGHGIGVAGNRLFRNKFFEEHGTLMVLACVIPRSAYYGGLNRHNIKLDRFSYYWPEFSNIGEQPVYKSELYFNPDNVPDYNDPSEIFGYQERYAEYRYHNDEVHGKFQTDLSFWHQARSFDSTVALNGSFVQCNPSDRIFALQDSSDDTEQIYANILFKEKMFRTVTPRGIPAL